MAESSLRDYGLGIVLDPCERILVSDSAWRCRVDGRVDCVVHLVGTAFDHSPGDVRRVVILHVDLVGRSWASGIRCEPFDARTTHQR